MRHPSEERCLRVAAATGNATVTATDTALTIHSAGLSGRLDLPTTKQGWDKLDFRSAFPKRARGDQRETLLHATIQDALPGADARPGDSTLSQQLSEPHVLPATDGGSREVLAEILRAEYWVTPGGRGGSSGTSRPISFPLHTALPLNFTQYGPGKRYKMYRGDIMLFLNHDGHDIARVGLEELVDLLNSTDGMNLLDELFHTAVINAAAPGAPTSTTVDALLSSSQASTVRGFLAHGAYCPAPMRRYREDLAQTLALPLPRHDRIDAVMLTLSLHLALYYYEVAFKLGQGVDALIRAVADLEPEPAAPLDGQIAFRVGISAGRPVRRSDGCAAAWRALDERYLLALGPNIMVTNYLHELWAATGATVPPNPDPSALADAMHADLALRQFIDAGARSLAILIATRASKTPTPEELDRTASLKPGIYALRQSLLRHRRSTLRHLGRDVVNQLGKRTFGGSLIRTRGSVTFFELDEEFLFLLVYWIVQRHGGPDRQVPLGEFLVALSSYGFVPQDGEETQLLTATLERLGMLQRYSDAGEATYVRHAL